MDYSNITPFTQNYSYSSNSISPHQNVSSSTLQSDNSDSSSPREMFCWRYEDNVHVFTLIIISTCFALTPLAIYCLYSQVRSDRVIPVFIINLLLSDIIQVCCMVVQVAKLKDDVIKYILINNVYNCGVMASVFFMTFIAMERYLLIAWPLWYRLQQKLKISASVSFVSWILSLYIGFNNGMWLGAVLVVPLPLLIFFFVRTFKALSTSQNVQSTEKRQIMAVLTLVVFAYTLTFLPHIITEFWWWWGWWDHDYTTFYTTLTNFMSVSCTLIQLNPVTDLLLYILLKKWVFDKLLVLLSCCRKTKDVHHQTNSITTTTCSWSASQGQTEAENNP